MISVLKYGKCAFPLVWLLRVQQLLYWLTNIVTQPSTSKPSHELLHSHLIAKTTATISSTAFKSPKHSKTHRLNPSPPAWSNIQILKTKKRFSDKHFSFKSGC